MNLRFLIVVVLLLLVPLLAYAQEKNVPVQNNKPILDPGRHIAKDVVVYRTKIPHDSVQARAYGIAFYRVERDTLRLFEAYYGSDVQYNRATYNWENDTSFTLKLQNSKNRKLIFLKVFGHGTTTGIIEP